MIISMFQMHAMRAISVSLAKMLTHRSIPEKSPLRSQNPGLMPKEHMDHGLLRLDRRMIGFSLETEYYVFLLRNNSNYLGW